MLGIQRLTNNEQIPKFDPEMLEESFTHFGLKNFPNSITYKFLSNNITSSIKEIAIECITFENFIGRIQREGAVLINTDNPSIEEVN